jgi:hypothetical protein
MKTNEHLERAASQDTLLCPPADQCCSKSDRCAITQFCSCEDQINTRAIYRHFESTIYLAGRPRASHFAVSMEMLAFGGPLGFVSSVS